MVKREIGSAKVYLSFSLSGVLAIRITTCMKIFEVRDWGQRVPSVRQ